MQSFGDDNDFGASPSGSSEDEQNELMDNMDEVEPEVDPDPEVEEEEEEEEEGEGDYAGEDNSAQDNSQSYYPDSPIRKESRHPLQTQVSASSSNDWNERSKAPGQHGNLPPTTQPRPTVLLTSPSPQPSSATSVSAQGAAINYPQVRPEALTAPVYDIAPTIAAPHSTSINSITATPDMRWVFSGGADGYIRKFNWVETANGKVMLTVAQRHPFVDSVTKAGVLASYWENDEPHAKAGEDGQSLSPVYSLAVHNQGLWLLSGLESGGINLQSVRHDEGKRITCLKQHTSAVSVLNLAKDEKSVLSGSWDKMVLDWDLNTGQVRRSFQGSGGQISALEMRPLSSIPVPETVEIQPTTNGTFSSDSSDKPRPNGVLTNGVAHNEIADISHVENGILDAPGSPADSLFGGNDGDSLFGDNDEDNPEAPAPATFGDDDDDEFSRAIANGIQQQENEDAQGDSSMLDADLFQGEPLTNGVAQDQEKKESDSNDGQTLPKPSGIENLSNGLPHADDMEVTKATVDPVESASDSLPTEDSTFLAASFDGTIRIWDRRKATPVAKLSPSKGVPPWCMNACWSPDGNFIFAGRRNGTVDEYSVHKGLSGSERVLKFPTGSGAVSAVRAMPNGRHLICASYDILRLYDLQEQQAFKHSTVPFLIVPGHRTGMVSQLYIDPMCRFMISTAGNRGWEGNHTEVLLGYEINIGN